MWGGGGERDIRGPLPPSTRERTRNSYTRIHTNVVGAFFFHMRGTIKDFFVCGKTCRCACGLLICSGTDSLSFFLDFYSTTFVQERWMALNLRQVTQPLCTYIRVARIYVCIVVREVSHRSW